MKTLLIAILVLSVVAVNAQKLPNVQTKSVRTPQNVKVDGKLVEWDDTFQAHNHATDISYILSNDDENLYLVIQAVDMLTINRVAGNGFTLNIQNGKKDKTGVQSFTYPAYDRTSGLHFMFDKMNDTSATAQANTILNANRYIGEKAKHIYVTGVTGVDSMLSVYNETGIKVQGAIDNRKYYNVELLIPLKYLHLSAGDKFTYQMIVKGADRIDDMVGMGFADTPTGEILRQKAIARAAAINAPTDFWGEYRLAKK